MTAAIIRFSDLSGLELKTLTQIAIATSLDIDAGADKHALLDRIMRAIADKTMVSGNYCRHAPLRQREASGLASAVTVCLFVATVITWAGILGG